jgi:GT2 family glycosyltransferase
VDNASTDSSMSIIEKKFMTETRLKVLKSGQNLGFSAGNNLGFVHTKGEYIAFLNNDTIADSEWLNALVNTLEQDKTIGLAGSTILSIDGTKLRGAGGLWSDNLLFLCPVGAGRRGDFRFIPTFEVSFATGCSMIARKELLDKVGLFDPSIPYNYDDTLLSLKTWLAGKRVVSVSASRICHIGGATTTKFWNIQSVTFSHLRARMCLLFDAYYNIGNLFNALSVLFFSIFVVSLFSLRKRNLAKISGNIQASLWLLKNLRHVWNNRLDHWKNAKISPEILLTKFIRIRIKFPISAIPSTLTDSLYRNECTKYENGLVK